MSSRRQSTKSTSPRRSQQRPGRHPKTDGATPRAAAAAPRLAAVYLAARTRLDHPPCLLLGRQPPVWGELIDQVWQMLTQASEQVIRAHAGLLAQCIERIAPERIRQFLGCDLLVWAGADPGLRGSAMSAVLQFLYDVRKAAAQHASSRGTAEHTAQSAREEVTYAATGLGAGGCGTWRAAWFAAEQSTEDIVESTARSAATRCG